MDKFFAAHVVGDVEWRVFYIGECDRAAALATFHRARPTLSAELRLFEQPGEAASVLGLEEGSVLEWKISDASAPERWARPNL